ncbi:MAG TPA: HupE/UreJ family protein [Anaeromyxobacteraceae bacterium]|nr:HupE/UreJ family protein [Anaeromyxobacteraceae bacterium]
MLRIPLRSLALVLLCAASPRSARGHEFTMDALMNAFVRVDEREVHLVVRVPIFALRHAGFPLAGREVDVAGSGPAIQRALALIKQDVQLWEGDRLLAPSSAVGRLQLPSDRSFDKYQDALADAEGTPAPGTVIYADQGFLDAHLDYPIDSPHSRFSIGTTVFPEVAGFMRLAIRYLPPGEDGRAMVITSRAGRVSLSPAWYQAAATFVGLGITHILGGVDHLLFLLCLILPFARLRQVIPIVTAFTVAHSFTLIGSAYHLAPSGAWFPPFVETAIAASIVYMALENIVGVDLRRRWVLTGLFGLVHGFGFSYGLKENLQFAGRHLLVALFSFNVGIEIGQVLVLAAILPVLALVRRHVLVGRVGIVIASALVAHTGWHWMIDRGEVLWKTEWPPFDAQALAVLARWVAGMLLAIGLMRFAARRAGNLFSRRMAQ